MLYKVLQYSIGKFFEIREISRLFFILLVCTIFIIERYTNLKYIKHQEKQRTFIKERIYVINHPIQQCPSTPLCIVTFDCSVSNFHMVKSVNNHIRLPLFLEMFFLNSFFFMSFKNALSQAAYYMKIFLWHSIIVFSL